MAEHSRRTTVPRHDRARVVRRDDRVERRIEHGAKALLGTPRLLELARLAHLLRDVRGDEGEPDHVAVAIASRIDDHPRRESRPVLSPPLDDPLPLPVPQCVLCDLRRLADRDVLRRMEQRYVRLADDVARLVSVQAPGALVPEEDGPVEIEADDRVLGGRAEHAVDEVGGLVGRPERRAIGESERHPLPRGGTCRMVARAAGRGGRRGRRGRRRGRSACAGSGLRTPEPRRR